RRFIEAEVHGHRTAIRRSGDRTVIDGVERVVVELLGAAENIAAVEGFAADQSVTSGVAAERIATLGSDEMPGPVLIVISADQQVGARAPHEQIGTGAAADL